MRSHGGILGGSQVLQRVTDTATCVQGRREPPSAGDTRVDCPLFGASLVTWSQCLWQVCTEETGSK